MGKSRRHIEVSDAGNQAIRSEHLHCKQQRQRAILSMLIELRLRQPSPSSSFQRRMNFLTIKNK